MRRAIPLLLAAVALLSGPTPAAAARPACARQAERVVASTTRLVVLRDRHDRQRIVCRRRSGRRHDLVALFHACSHCASVITRVVLRGDFAHALLSHTAWNDQHAVLATLDTRTGRTRRATIALADQGAFSRTDVTDVVAAAGGRVVLRARNDVAAGIVLVDRRGATWLDEGRTRAIGRPRVRAGRVVWRHGSVAHARPLGVRDRCPPTPPAAPPAQILATVDAVTSGAWHCDRAAGRTGRLDGVAVRLVGALAAVERSRDLRVVDLRRGATVAGPVVAQRGGRLGLGPDGTLVVQREGACGGEHDVEIVAVGPGAPERRVACGDIGELRYVDGRVRYRDRGTRQVFEVAVP